MDKIRGRVVWWCTLEFRADGRDESGQDLADALVHVDVGVRHVKQERQDQGQRGLDVASEHRATRVRYQSQRVEGPYLTGRERESMRKHTAISLFFIS